MTHMTNTGSHWPGAARRRAAARDQVDEQAAREQAAGIAGTFGRADRVPGQTAAYAGTYGSPVDEQRATVTAARGVDVRDLDDDDRAAFLAILARAGHDHRHASDRVAVGRIPRHGYVLGVTMYDVDERGALVVVLGQPVIRQHFIPVPVDQMPMAWRQMPGAGR